MTNEEAINLLKTLKEKHLHNGTYDKALKMGAEALEKQIPTKPRKIMERGAFRVGFECGNCGTTFGDVSKRFVKCCPFCGQAIDWSDIK